MIIKTRYRTLTKQEYLEHLTPIGRAVARGDIAKWYDPHKQGGEFQIETPPLDFKLDTATCDGPFYRVVGGPGYVCPHIAEIGD